MPANVTLSGLIIRAQSRADMVNANFVSSGEWTTWANSAATDLFDKISQADPERYAQQYNFVLQTSNSGVQPLPPDFYKLLRVDLLYGSGNPPLFYTLRKFSLLEEDAYQFPAFVTLAGPAYRYRLRNNYLELTPSPNASATLRMWYLPVMTTMNVATDTLDGVNGWEEKVVLDMAISALLKENATDVSALTAERNKWEEKIKALALERDTSFPEQTIDVSRGPWPYRGDGGGGWGGGM